MSSLPDPVLLAGALNLMARAVGLPNARDVTEIRITASPRKVYVTRLLRDENGMRYISPVCDDELARETLSAPLVWDGEAL